MKPTSALVQAATSSPLRPPPMSMQAFMMWPGAVRPIVLDAGQKSRCVDRENDRNIG
ncbi:hypothetical protein [Paraburkholderia xenovorans]|uniref:hypothetical protein n=1 Tax=Paraburkholderia xenovorans TaxID=36873 RepID=UPI0038B8D42A